VKKREEGGGMKIGLRQYSKPDSIFFIKPRLKTLVHLAYSRKSLLGAIVFFYLRRRL
jgi:hypothetical protein